MLRMISVVLQFDSTPEPVLLLCQEIYSVVQ